MMAQCHAGCRARQSHDLGRLIGRYLNEPETEGIEKPLRQSFTLAAMLNDLCELAEVQPAGVFVPRQGHNL
jgi:predicted HD phosphohydrolase